MTALSPNRTTALAALGEPVRRDLYRALTDAKTPMSRDELAAALGIPRSTAAFHLERLTEAGLLEVEHRRRSGRSGPGAGRPAKLYAPASRDLLASIPERHYELAGQLLAAAIDRAESAGEPIREALNAEAERVGVAIGAAESPLDAALTACGYDPVEDETGCVRLANCPFHALATAHTDLMCGANVALVRGLAAGSGDDRRTVLEPDAGRCCVVLHPADERA